MTAWKAIVIIWTLTGSPETDSFDFAAVMFATKESCVEAYGDHCFEVFMPKPKRRE